MKRTGFARKAPARTERTDRSAEFASVVIERPRAVMAQAIDRERPVTAPKDDRHSSEAWRRAVAELPCVLCGREGDTQAAHRNEGKGMGLKTDDALTAALCTTCHSAIDQGPDYSRDERRRRIDAAILLTVRQLARAGKLRIA